MYSVDLLCIASREEDKKLAGWEWCGVILIDRGGRKVPNVIVDKKDNSDDDDDNENDENENDFLNTQTQQTSGITRPEMNGNEDTDDTHGMGYFLCMIAMVGTYVVSDTGSKDTCSTRY